MTGTGLSAKPGVSLYAAGEGGKKSWLEQAVDAIIDYLSDLALEKYGPPSAGELVKAPELVEKVTGDSGDLVRGVAPFYRLNDGEHYSPAIRDATDDGKNKYINPDADPSVSGAQPGQIDPEFFSRLMELRRMLNTLPSNIEELPPIQIDPSRVRDPFSKPLVSDPNPENQDMTTTKSPGEIINPKGPDTVNPNDEVAPPPLPTDIPGTPRGGGSLP